MVETNNLGPVHRSMLAKLNTTFDPVTHLDIKNDSHKHASHAAMIESPGTGESHFVVTIVSQTFEGVSLINRHRMVNECLANELKSVNDGGMGVHALNIKAKTPA